MARTSLLVVSGEAKSQVNGWLNMLQALIAVYAPCDVFNADEAGLFFNMQLERSLCVKGQPCKGGRKSEEHVIVLFCVSANGSEKIHLTVIGKSK